MADHDVTIIGCGLMGSALARGLARSGLRVAAWNRTHERAEALAGDGITPMRSVVDAVAASPLIVACTTSYEAAVSALDPVESWHGATLVNLTSGTPEEAEECERWAAARGVEYLDGVLFCYPKDIGSPEATIFYSGAPGLWSRHEGTLMRLGGASRHVSERITTANVMFVGMFAFFLAAQSAYVEAATYLLGQGVEAATLREISVPPVETLHYSSETAANAIASGDFETDQATIEIYAEGARPFLAAMRRAGIRSRVFAAALENLEAAEAAGLGKLGVPAHAMVIGGAVPGAASPDE